jgi:hypothetical protein
MIDVVVLPERLQNLNALRSCDGWLNRFELRQILIRQTAVLTFHSVTRDVRNPMMLARAIAKNLSLYPVLSFGLQ